MREKRENFRNKRSYSVLEEMKNIIEAEEKAGNVTEANWEIVRNKLTEYIDEKLAELENLNNSKGTREFDRNVLPSSGVFSGNAYVVLKVIDATEKDNYMKVSEQCAVSLKMFEETKEDLWSEFLSNNSYVCSIYDAPTGNYVGYCSIKELNASEWEIAIELLEEYRNKKYGTRALNLFMDRLTEITGNRFYKFLIDIDNEPSQKLARRLGAYPDGLAEFLIHGEKLEQFREENKDMIDEHVIQLAEEFTSDPEDLIGMVLQFRIDQQRRKKCREHGD